MTNIDLCFVTPVHDRHDLAAICLEQRRRMCDELSESDVTATAVLIGDDPEFRRLAREFDFHWVEQMNNVGLGRKFNDGVEYACRDLDATRVVPIGSDDWAMAGYFLQPPGGGDIRTGKHLSVVNHTGTEIACLTHEFRQSTNPRGFIPWIVPRTELEATGYRPNYDARTRGIDADMGLGICRTNPRPTWTPMGLDPLQCVDFKNPTTQITPYERTVEMNHGVAYDGEPFELLATRYPIDLVERMSELYHKEVKV